MGKSFRRNAGDLGTELQKCGGALMRFEDATEKSGAALENFGAVLEELRAALERTILCSEMEF